MSISISRNDFLKNIVEKVEARTGKKPTKKLVQEMVTAVEALLLEDYTDHAFAEQQTVQVPFCRSTMKILFTPPHTSRDPRTGAAVDVEARCSVTLGTKRKGAQEANAPEETVADETTAE